jgi:hypothetical protein
MNYIRPKEKTEGFIFGLVSPTGEGRRLNSELNSKALEADDI